MSDSNDYFYIPNKPQVYEKDPPDKPILYGAKGQPLYKLKAKLGFRPPERKQDGR